MVPITLVLALAALLVVGVVIRRRGAASPDAEDVDTPESATRDELILAIAELDNRLENNEITEQEHQHQRQILKARLLEREMDARETLEK